MSNDNNVSRQPVENMPFKCKDEIECNFFIWCFQNEGFLTYPRRDPGGDGFLVDYELKDKSKNFEEQFNIALNCYANKLKVK